MMPILQAEASRRRVIEYQVAAGTMPLEAARMQIRDWNRLAESRPDQTTAARGPVRTPTLIDPRRLGFGIRRVPRRPPASTVDAE